MPLVPEHERKIRALLPLLRRAARHRNLVSESGWRECPRIRDMTEIHFSASTCQVEGEIVPAAEINLGAGDADLLRAPRDAVEGRNVPLTADAAFRRV